MITINSPAMGRRKSVILWRPAGAVLAFLMAIKQRSMLPILEFLFGLNNQKNR